MKANEKANSGVWWGGRIFQGVEFRRWGARVLAVAILLPVSVPGAAGPARFGETRSALEKWVEARQQLSKNKTEWQNDKETILATIALYESELKDLERLRTTVRTNSISVVKEAEELKVEQANLIKASEELTGLVAGLEQQILAMTNALPQALLSLPNLDQALRSITANGVETKTPVPNRLGNVLGILNEIDKFNSMVTVEPEVQTDPSGASIQVTKIYLGLGQAYFVNESGTYAGVGVPSASGWTWTTRNELAPVIARVKRQYEDLDIPAFVGLPVEIK